MKQNGEEEEEEEEKTIKTEVKIPLYINIYIKGGS